MERFFVPEGQETQQIHDTIYTSIIDVWLLPEFVAHVTAAGLSVDIHGRLLRMWSRSGRKAMIIGGWSILRSYATDRDGGLTFHALRRMALAFAAGDESYGVGWLHLNTSDVRENVYRGLLQRFLLEQMGVGAPPTREHRVYIARQLDKIQDRLCDRYRSLLRLTPLAPEETHIVLEYLRAEDDYFGDILRLGKMYFRDNPMWHQDIQQLAYHWRQFCAYAMSRIAGD